ncbi:hypothetical protein [Streptomyces sp. NPDC001774]
MRSGRTSGGSSSWGRGSCLRRPGDTLAGHRYDKPTGLDWRPVHGRVLRAGGRVVLATSRQRLDVLMSGVQPHPPGAQT